MTIAILGDFGKLRPVPIIQADRLDQTVPMERCPHITLYEIQLEGGQIIRVSRPNLSRHDQEDFTWDDKVSMHWRADSPVVLLS